MVSLFFPSLSNIEIYKAEYGFSLSLVKSVGYCDNALDLALVVLTNVEGKDIFPPCRDQSEFSTHSKLFSPLTLLINFLKVKANKFVYTRAEIRTDSDFETNECVVELSPPIYTSPGCGSFYIGSFGRRRLRETTERTRRETRLWSIPP